MEKVNLLLVDDDSRNLLALTALLDRPDYNLVPATSGRMALDLLARNEFGVVLLDVMMPGMDGFEVAKRMKEDEAMRYVPILFVTAIAKDLKEIYRGYALGGVDYILKPLEPDIVQAKVSVFVELFRHKKEIQRKSEIIRQSEKAQSLEREHQARLRAEDAERRFRNLVNALDHAVIWEASPDLSTFTFISEQVEGILGYPREQWLQEPDFLMNHVLREDQSKLRQCMDNLLHGEGRALGERCDHRIISSDGAVKWFHTGMQHERDSFGKIVKMRGLCVDISPLKRVEERLRAAIQAREEIVSIVAHDLKTPLSAADLRANLLRLATDKGDLGEIKKQAVQVSQAIKHSIRLTENILDAERIESGHVLIEPEEQSIGGLVKEAADLIRPLALEKSIQLNVAGDDIGTVYCDRERILQVLSNLIGNAIKFSPEKSQIVVHGENKNGNAEFSVEDKGDGIPDDQLLHVFDRYWQGKKKRGFGLGLGLAISKGIIEAHGGKLWVESKVGDGSVFRFSLPAHAPSAAG